MADTVPFILMARRFCVPVERLFAAWTRPALLQELGITRATIDLRPGGAFRYETDSPSGIHVVSGVLLTFEPPHRIVQSWNYAGPQGPSEFTVAADFRPLRPDASALSVREEGASLADEQARKNGEAAWTSVFDGFETLFSKAKEGQG